MMNFRRKRVVRSTPLYFILYFFLLRYLLALVCSVSDWFILGVTIGLCLLHFVPTVLETGKPRFITRLLSEIYGVWQWFSVMYLIEVIFIYVVKSFIDIPLNVIYILLAIVPLIGIYGYSHAHDIKVKERIIKFDNLDDDINIIHVSDVHYGTLIYKKTLNNLVDKIKSLEDSCDLVVISGDLADGSRIIDDDAFLPFKDINIPIIFTTGNHDYYPGLDNVYRACQKAGMIILHNESYQYKNLNLYGLIFSFTSKQTATEEDLVNAIDSQKLNIIIYHAPYNFDELSHIGFDLQLSGHTHGGQFHPIVWAGDLLYGYNRGLYSEDFDGKIHYIHVTTGVGVMDYPIRWGTDSEIVVLKLRKK